MNWKTLHTRQRLYLISALVMAVGLAGAAIIYLAAADEGRNALGYEVVGGNAYLVTPENSKKYVHDLKVMGGTAAVVADEFGRWFDGLWHGTSLAYTVAVMAGLVSLGFFLAARTTPPDGSVSRDEPGRSSP